MILLAFQALCGSLYQQLGLVVAVFMAGLAAGAWAAASWNVNPKQNNIPGTFPIQSPERKLAVLAAALAAVSLMLIPGLSGISRLAGSGASLWLVQLVILAMTFVVAGVVGAEFPMAVRATGGEGAAASAKIYSADFLGASLGGWLAATWLAPTLGLANVCLLTGGINLVCAALLWIIRR
jgi:spermidine synthase